MCVCVCVSKREKRDRQTDIKRESYTDRQTQPVARENVCVREIQR